jgi:hypothetical protein
LVEDSHLKIFPKDPVKVIVPLADPEHPEDTAGESVPPTEGEVTVTVTDAQLEL